MSKVILEGYGMSVPRLGEAYTLTIQSIVIEDEIDDPKCLSDSEEGREKQSLLLNRKKMNSRLDDKITRRFTHTFSKITVIEDTGTPDKGNGVIKIKGISPKINSMYVEAKISYPKSYNPPIIV